MTCKCMKLLWVLTLIFYGLTPCARVKDVAKLANLTDVQLTGFGLIIGLGNTGDGPRTLFTAKAVANMLRNRGIDIPQDRIRVRNVAAVMITAKMPPFIKKGSRIDVTVSSIGDARSLEGGTLLLSPLNGIDGKLYALSQGAVSIGGFNLESRSGLTAIRRNHTQVGMIPNGAIVQRELVDQVMPQNDIFYTLQTPDFSSAVRMTNAINNRFQDKVAYALDASSVSVIVPRAYQDRTMDFIAEVENVIFKPATPAKVVLNEKTGTVVAGGDVTVSAVAVSHGNITISIQSSQDASSSMMQGGAQTTVTTQSTSTEDAAVKEQKTKMKVLPNITNVNELASALNSLGVSPRDIISIFQSIKKAGALHADLEVM